MFFRHALSKGYPRNSTRMQPIYNVLNSQPLPGMDHVIHMAAKYWYFGMNGTEAERKWNREYQNYVSNFVRTGSPNGTFFNSTQIHILLVTSQNGRLFSIFSFVFFIFFKQRKNKQKKIIIIYLITFVPDVSL